MRTLCCRFSIVSLLVGAGGLATAGDLSCDGASNTLDINQCVKRELDSSAVILDRYIEASRKKFADDETLVRSIDEAQVAWEGYRKAHCDSVYDRWRDGSIRNVMALSCSISLTRQRTHDV